MSRETLFKSRKKRIQPRFSPSNKILTKEVHSSSIGRIIEIDDSKFETTWAVHLWDRSDRRAFTVEGVYKSQTRAEEALANA